MLSTSRVLLVVLLVFITAMTLSAQENTEEACPAIVHTALTAVDTACEGIGRNQVCYGNISIQAEARSDVVDLVFNNIGDTVDLTDIQSLALKELNEETGEWGVALLLIQANLPDTMPGQNVMVLLFGDVELTDASDGANPMQSFIFRSGVGEAACDEVPQSGMLIQTPEGIAEVSLNVNGVDMQVGSTAYLQAIAPGEEIEEGMLVVNLLEGQATITADDESVTIPAGQFSTVTLDENLEPISAPTEPEDYNADDFSALPLGLLEREIELIPSDDEGPSSSGTVELLSGTWLYSTAEMQFSDDCPSELVSYMPQIMPQVSVTEIIDWTGGFTVENYLAQVEMGGEPIPPGAVVTSPEPGVIRFEYAEQGTSVVVEARAISERLIETTMTMSMTGDMTCTIIIPGTVEYQGE